MYEGRLRRREVIIDENLSPSLAKPLEELGFSVKIFPKRTPEPDIIAYAKTRNSIVLTNNISDFKNQGVTAINVTANQEKNNNLIIQQLKVLSDKISNNASVAAPGKLVSLANP